MALAFIRAAVSAPLLFPPRPHLLIHVQWIDLLETSELLVMCNDNKVPTSFWDWMTKTSILNPVDLVWAARADKSRIDEDIIDASGLSLSLAEKIAVRKLCSARSR